MALSERGYHSTCATLMAMDPITSRADNALLAPSKRARLDPHSPSTLVSPLPQYLPPRWLPIQPTPPVPPRTILAPDLHRFQRPPRHGPPRSTPKCSEEPEKTPRSDPRHPHQSPRHPPRRLDLLLLATLRTRRRPVRRFRRSEHHGLRRRLDQTRWRR